MPVSEAHITPADPLERAALLAAVDSHWRPDPCSPDWHNERQLATCKQSMVDAWEYMGGGIIPYYAWCIPASLPYLMDTLTPRAPDLYTPIETLEEWEMLPRQERLAIAVRMAQTFSALWWYTGLMPIDCREKHQFADALAEYCPHILAEMERDECITSLHDIPEGQSPDRCPVPFDKLSRLLDGMAQDGNLWALTRRFVAGASKLDLIDGTAITDRLPRQQLPELELVAERYLGMAEYEVFDPVPALAMNSGKIFENLTRTAMQHVLQYNLQSTDEVREMGMKLAPYLPEFYAQSPDGEIAGVIVEIKTKWTGYTYDTIPRHYLGQTLQAALCSGRDRCVFAAGQRRVDEFGYTKPVEPNVMELTVEMLMFSPEILARYRRLLVAFAMFAFQYARQHILHSLKESESAEVAAAYPDLDARLLSACRAQKILRAAILRERMDVQKLAETPEGIARIPFQIPQEDPETGDRKMVPVRQLALPMLEFVCGGDPVLYDYWMRQGGGMLTKKIAAEQLQRKEAYLEAMERNAHRFEQVPPAPLLRVPIQRFPVLHAVCASGRRPAVVAPARKKKVLTQQTLLDAGALAPIAEEPTATTTTRKRKRAEPPKGPLAKRRATPIIIDSDEDEADALDRLLADDEVVAAPSQKGKRKRKAPGEGDDEPASAKAPPPKRQKRKDN